jgi:hypothetical protein
MKEMVYEKIFLKGYLQNPKVVLQLDYGKALPKGGGRSLKGGI